jgi:IS30 family transposase
LSNDSGTIRGMALRLTEDLKRKMLRWRELGIPDAEIARRVGKSREWVGQALGRKNGRK